MDTVTIRDRLWLWGMPVNALQEGGEFDEYALPQSTMTVQGAIQRTGITNVILAGGLPIDDESLASMPSATRIICKTELHRLVDGKNVLDYNRCLSGLLAAKRLAAVDARIEGFLLDDFSTGSIDAGAKPDHLAKLEFENAVRPHVLPLSSTIYTMSLDRPEIPGLLPHFGMYLAPIWDSDLIETLATDLDQLSEMSGGKPAMLCLYLYDFGANKLISRELMQRHLDVAERQLREGRITGLCMCGTCMMDLDWDSNRVFYNWVNLVGDIKLA
jgi:hypothetical protein